MDYSTARQVLVSTDFGPPGMSEYLAEIERESGKDLSSLRHFCQIGVTFQSGAEHVRLRRMLASFFGQRGVHAWRPTIENEVTELLDRLAVRTDFDLLHDFADPLFAATVPRMLGVRVPDDARMLDLIALARQLVEPLLTPNRMVAVQHAFDEMLGWVRDSATEQAESHPPSFIQELIRDGGAFETDPALPALVVSMLVAAHTTSETLGFILWRILRAPIEDRRRAAGESDWVEAHLESLLRLYPSTLHVGRESNTAEGNACPHPEGRVWVHVPSANRDPDVFDATSDEGPLQETEERYPHLSFGAGAHKCPGADFARLTLRIAIPALLKRFPTMELLGDDVQWVRSEMIRMPARLPCRVT